MDAQRLLAGYKRVLAEIYKPKMYFERCLKLLHALKTHRTSRRRVRIAELRAFVLSLVRQTFSRYWWAYWRFLVRGFLAKPLMVGEAVTMAVKGHHFFKMTRNVLEVDRIRVTLEDLARSFERSIRDLSAVDISERITELTAYRDRVVARMHARCRRINKDFRVYAEEAVAQFRATMDGLIARLVSEAPPPAPA
jgi:hypothetical protein